MKVALAGPPCNLQTKLRSASPLLTCTVEGKRTRARNTGTRLYIGLARRVASAIAWNPLPLD